MKDSVEIKAGVVVGLVVEVMKLQGNCGWQVNGTHCWTKAEAKRAVLVAAGLAKPATVDE